MRFYKFAIGDLVQSTFIDARGRCISSPSRRGRVGVCIGYYHSSLNEYSSHPQLKKKIDVVLYKILFSNGTIYNRTGYNLEKLT